MEPLSTWTSTLWLLSWELVASLILWFLPLLHYTLPAAALAPAAAPAAVRPTEPEEPIAQRTRQRTRPRALARPPSYVLDPLRSPRPLEKTAPAPCPTDLT